MTSPFRRQIATCPRYRSVDTARFRLCRPRFMHIGNPALARRSPAYRLCPGNHATKRAPKRLEENPIDMRPSNKRIEQRGWAEWARFARKAWFLRCSS